MLLYTPDPVDTLDLLWIFCNEVHSSDSFQALTYKPWLQAIIGKLKAKRFRQIFDYLDTAGAGELDLVTLVSALPAVLSHCSAESGAHRRCRKTSAVSAVLLWSGRCCRVIV